MFEEMILRDLEKDGLITKIELKRALEILHNKMKYKKTA